MTDLNLHVGCQGVFGDFAQQLHDLRPNEQEFADIALVSRSDYRNQCRRASQTGELEDIEFARTGTIWKSLQSNDHLLHVISNPHILGSQKNVTDGEVLYPSAHNRLWNLIRVFEGADISIRILVCEISQFSRNNGLRKQPAHMSPWSELVNRIGASIGSKASVDVFAVSDPFAFSRNLTAMIFDPPVWSSSSHFEVAESALFNFLDAAGNSASPDEIDSYHEDLARIDTSNNVRVHLI